MRQLIIPFEQLGSSLRSLSLSGSTGNIVAITIYCLISMIPFFGFLWLKKKKRNRKADWFLPILSVLLFMIIYYLVNPTLFMANSYLNVLDASGLMLAGLFYAFLSGYLILRGVEYCMSPDAKNLQKGFRTLLYIMVLLIILAVIKECFFILPEAIHTLKEKNSVSGTWAELVNATPDLRMTSVFLVLQSVGRVIPYLFDMTIIWMLIRLMREFEVDRYSEKVAQRIERIGVVCVRMLVVTVTLNIAINVFQVVCRNMLYQINMDISIPVLSITFALAVLLISRYVRETQKMKEELDMFI